MSSPEAALTHTHTDSKDDERTTALSKHVANYVVIKMRAHGPEL